MGSKARKPIVMGNWKLHGDMESNQKRIAALRALMPAQGGIWVVCPSFLHIHQVVSDLKGSSMLVGSQNCFYASSGAYTGEISPQMLREINCEYVIIGHSERRALFGESDGLIAKKVQAVADSGMIPVICVGETQQQRDAQQTESVIQRQLQAVMAILDQIKTLVIAYEPVWAIGTGVTATPEIAQKVHKYIRALLAQLDAAKAAQTQIIYGGSVKANNAASLFTQPDIDGGLVGGASLDAEAFSEICRAALSEAAG